MRESVMSPVPMSSQNVSSGLAPVSRILLCKVPSLAPQGPQAQILFPQESSGHLGVAIHR